MRMMKLMGYKKGSALGKKLTNETYERDEKLTTTYVFFYFQEFDSNLQNKISEGRRFKSVYDEIDGIQERLCTW